MVERTLIILKPDCVHRRFVGEAILRFEQKGFRIAGLKMMAVSRELAERHYAEHEGKPFYEKLLAFITSSPVVALAIEGQDAIATVRKIVGTTDGRAAEAGTLRGDFGQDATLNLVHASDSPESAAREISLFFVEEELFSYRVGDEPWLQADEFMKTHTEESR